MSTIVYVPRDSSALSVGAEKVASAISQEAAKRGLAVTIVRNGSRGLFWLETMVEVATDKGRVAYGPVKAADVCGLFEADFLNTEAASAKAHPLHLGLTEELAWLKQQQRLTFARVGITDPVSLEDYLAHDGYQGLKNALALSAADIVKTVTDSGLRGRGGAAFPTGIKWNTVLGCAADQKYIVCNADEGDSGTYSDRMIMENDPYVLIEGMTIAGIAVGVAAELEPAIQLAMVGQQHAPVLGLYGTADTGIPLESVDRMKAALAQGSPAAKTSQFVVYPDAPHAFHADYRPSYRQGAAEDGWQRLLAWLHSHGVF